MPMLNRSINPEDPMKKLWRLASLILLTFSTVLGQEVPGKIDRVVLGHLSRDCNTPALALQTVRNSLTKCGKMDIELFCATQSVISPRFRIGETMAGAFQPTFETAFFPAAGAR